MSAPEPLSAERRAELRETAETMNPYIHRVEVLALLDQADEAVRLAGEAERLRGFMELVAEALSTPDLKTDLARFAAIAAAAGTALMTQADPGTLLTLDEEIAQLQEHFPDVEVHRPEPSGVGDEEPCAACGGTGGGPDALLACGTCEGSGWLDREPPGGEG